MKQISVVSKKRPGIIAEITQALANENININTMVSEVIDEHAVTILTVDHYDDALRILQNLPETTAITEDAILVRLEDKPGALAKIAVSFQEAGILINSIRIVERSGQESLAAICTERTEEALELVKDCLIA